MKKDYEYDRRTEKNSALRELVGQSAQREGVYRTVETLDSAGSTSTVYEVEELEELEARGINPYFDKSEFRKLVKAEAQNNNVWLDKTYLDDKVLIHDQKKTGTSENDVYLNADGKTLTKLNNLAYVTGADRLHNLAMQMDRLVAHNVLFPNSAYTIIGFMENKNGFPSLVLEQPYIKDVDGNATKKEIDEFLTKNGFKKDGEREWSNGHDVWTNGTYELFDARPANVLKGKNGELYFIDTIPHTVEYLHAVAEHQEHTEQLNRIGRDTHPKLPK